MVDDETILGVVEDRGDDLKTAAERLIDEANRAGGEDNITVVLFEFANLEDTVELPAPVYAPGGDDEDTLTGLDPLPALTTEQAAPARRPRRRRRLWRVVVPVVVVLLVALAAGAVFGLSRAHFVGAQGNGHLAVYQGVPWNLPFGIHLYRLVYESPVLAVQLSRVERQRLFDHNLRSKGNAVREVKSFERDVIQ
jgi:protein phosphatase